MIDAAKLDEVLARSALPGWMEEPALHELHALLHAARELLALRAKVEAHNARLATRCQVGFCGPRTPTNRCLTCPQRGRIDIDAPEGAGSAG